MKNKLRLLLVGSACALGLSIPCFADQAQGLVKSINPSESSILIQDPVSGNEKAVRVHPKLLSEVKKGSVVKATFAAGSNTADTVEVLIPR